MPEHIQESDRLDPQIWKIVLVAILGSLLAQLDATVVNVSLASLAQDLHTTLPIIQWVTNGLKVKLNGGQEVEIARRPAKVFRARLRF